MPAPSRSSQKRTRLTPQARQAQIVEAASRLVLDQGHLPLPLEALAREAGTSKALIYNYFRTQPDLFNAVLARQFRGLAARGIAEASAVAELNDAALTTALIYFEHVAETGPLIHLILRDPYMAGHVKPALAQFRNQIILRLARRSRRALRLRAKENLAAINMILTIPEEAGRLVHAGELSLERGRALCRLLVHSSLEAFTPLAGRPAPSV